MTKLMEDVSDNGDEARLAAFIKLHLGRTGGFKQTSWVL